MKVKRAGQWDPYDTVSVKLGEHTWVWHFQVAGSVGSRNASLMDTLDAAGKRVDLDTKHPDRARSLRIARKAQEADDPEPVVQEVREPGPLPSPPPTSATPSTPLSESDKKLLERYVLGKKIERTEEGVRVLELLGASVWFSADRDVGPDLPLEDVGAQRPRWSLEATMDGVILDFQRWLTEADHEVPQPAGLDRQFFRRLFAERPDDVDRVLHRLFRKGGEGVGG